jgi:trimeric autotransporter adhesin
MRKLYLLLMGMLLIACPGLFAQVTLSGTSYNENFDNIGTALPTGWTVRTSATTTALGTVATLATTAAAWNSTGGGFKNYASADGLNAASTSTDQNASTDRALGVRQTGTTGAGLDPGAAFVLQLNNTTGLTGFLMSFKLQSLDITSTRITTWRVDYGIGATPATFTAVGATSTTGGSAFTATNTLTVDFASALDNISQPVWIRIVTITNSTGSGNRASTGIDDVQLSYSNNGTVTTNVSVLPGTNLAEPATSGNFNILLSSAPASPITVNYDFTGSTATLGSDFTDPGNGSIVIPAGQTSAVIPINVIDDAAVEAPESININLTSATAPYTITVATASISLTSEDISTISFTGSYSEDFNTLEATTTSAITPTGWLFNETGTNANTTYAASDGSGSTFSGNTYSFGSTGSSERAFGETRSGSLVPTIGAFFINNTGATVTSLTITYTGEQWRLGTTGRNDRMDFQYSTNATNLTTGTWTDADGLDFIAPNGSGTVGALDGNATNNRKTITYVINGLLIPNGAEFAIRWTDFDVTGAEDGLAVDDFSMSLGCTPPTNQPTGLVLTPSLQSINGSFTAAAPGTTAADDYLVLMSMAASLTDLPATGTVYAIDDAVGSATVVSINGTSFTANGLTPSTTYYFYVFSTGGATCYNVLSPLTGNIATTSPPVCTTPVTQVTNLAATNITGNSMDLSWTRGDGDNILVIARSGEAVDATIYNSLAYPQGTVIGNANTVIYNGPAASFSYTGLNQNTTYYFALYEYNSASNCYLTPAVTGNFTTLCVNPVDVSSLRGVAGNNRATISWALPSGTCFDEIIVVAATGPITGAGSTYIASANTTYTSGEQVVYKGTGTTVTVTGLINGTTYYFKVFTRKGANYSAGVQIASIPYDPATGYQYLFGNLHAHSAYSDGNKDNTTKTPADDFAFGRDALCMDFLGISEHNHSGAGMSKPDFSLGYAQANSLNNSGPNSNFITLWGMEWGVISGGGHVLVYGFDDKLLGWESGNYDIFVAKNDYTSLWTTVLGQSGAFATLAHPNSGDYTDLASSYKASADAAIAGAAIESGPAFSTSTTYNDFPSALSYLPYYRNLLSKGYHVAPQMDQDNHYMTFGTANSNRMVVLSSTRSREGIMEAIRSMRYYASNDCNVKVDFKNGNNPMGSQVASIGTPSLTLTVSDPDLELVTNIELWGGEAGNNTVPSTVIKTYSNTDNFTFTSADAQNLQPNNTTWYYYAVITQEDGNKAVTAPIWYTRTDVPLPVLFTSFKGQYDQSVNKVDLTWTTAMESNSKEYIVERSTDGRTYTAIGKVAAAGNSALPSTYGFTDAQPVSGLNYYRLQQVDIDEKTTLSNVVRIKTDRSAGFYAGPNPAHTTVTIYRQGNNEAARIELMDVNGQLMKQLNIAATTYSTTINVSGLSKGIYLMKFTTSTGIHTQKIMVE